MSVEAATIPAVEAAPVKPKNGATGPETPTTVDPVKPAQGEDAARFAALAKKERALVAREREIKRIASEKEQQYSAQIAELEKLRAEAKRRADFRTKIESDPIAALEEEYGLTYEQITEARLNKGKTTGPWAVARSLAEKVKTLEQTQEERFGKLQQEQQQAREREQQESMAEFRADCEAFVDDNAEAFPLIASLGAKSLVAQQIELEYGRTGKRLSYQAAAEAVEKQLDEQIEKGQQARAKKVAAKTPETAPGKPNQAAQPRTLSNDLTGSTTPAAPLSIEERMKRAAAALDR